MIVKRQYPVERLPDDLRQGLPDDAKVEVRILLDPGAGRIRLSDLVGSGPNVHGTEQEVLDYLRAGREDR